jgi:uncharacterized protein YkwD
MNKNKTFLAILTVFTLVGCGGGGDNGSAYSDVPFDGEPIVTPAPGDSEYSSEYGNGDISPITYSGQVKIAFDYLNAIRVSAGVKPFTADSRLTLAAEKHATYLKTTNTFSHYEEDSSSPAYYEYSPSSRAQKAGYLSGVWENATRICPQNESFGKTSVNGLMSAIYHRFGFFSPTDSIGIDTNNEVGNEYAMVFDMGSSVAFPVNIAPGREYFLWPVSNGTDVRTAYKGGEIPNPLSDTGQDKSGYPVSVLFNSFEVDCSKIEMTGFLLKNDSAGEAKMVLKTMDENNDPNGHLDACSFALFPKDYLDFNTKYTAQFNYTYAGKRKEITWSFMTEAKEDFSSKYDYIVNIDSPNMTMDVSPGESILLLTEDVTVFDSKFLGDSSIEYKVNVEMTANDDSYFGINIISGIGTITVEYENGYDITINVQ